MVISGENRSSLGRRPRGGERGAPGIPSSFLLVAVFSLAVVVPLPYFLLPDQAHTLHGVISVMTGAALLIPLFAAHLQGRFDVFEPIWVFVLVYGIEYWAKPLLVLRHPDMFTLTFFEYESSSMRTAMALGLAGLLAFYGGYYGQAGRALALRVPTLRWPWSRGRFGFAWAACAAIFGALVYYFLEKGNFSLEYMYLNRQEVNFGSGEFVFLIHLAGWLTAAFAAVGFLLKRKALGWLSGFVVLAVVGGLSIFGARMGVLQIPLSLLVIRHYLVRPFTLRFCAAAFVVFFGFSALLGAFRSEFDASYFSVDHVPKVVADEIVGYAGWDTLSAVVSVFPDRHDFFLGRLAGESVYWFLPRRIWADKPLIYGPTLLQEEISPGALAETPDGYLKGTFLGQSTLGEGYADFGWPGALAYIFMFGVVFRALYEYMQLNRSAFPGVAMYAWFFSFLPLASRGFSGTLVHMFLYLGVIYAVFWVLADRPPFQRGAGREGPRPEPGPRARIQARNGR